MSEEVNVSCEQNYLLHMNDCLTNWVFRQVAAAAVHVHVVGRLIYLWNHNNNFNDTIIIRRSLTGKRGAAHSRPISILDLCNFQEASEISRDDETTLSTPLLVLGDGRGGVHLWRKDWRHIYVRAPHRLNNFTFSTSGRERSATSSYGNPT